MIATLDHTSCITDSSGIQGHKVTHGQGALYRDTWTGKAEEEDAVQALVHLVKSDGIAGYDTYRVALMLTAQDVQNIFTIYGTTANPLRMPPAHQVEAGQILDIGGVSPGIIATNPDAAYDSWLTVGVVDGSIGSISSASIDYSLWSDTTGLIDPDGAVYWQFSTKGPARKANAEVVIAQLTVPTGTCFSGSVNAQGHTIEHSPNPTWKAEGIQFKGGPSTCVSPAPAPTPKPTTSTSPTGSTSPPASADSGGGGGTAIVIIILLIAAVGGVGYAYKIGKLPPALAAPLDNIFKKPAGGGGAATGGDGIYSKSVDDSEL